MKHLKCGGSVNEKAVIQYCDKCGRSKAGVEKDNARFEATAVEPTKKSLKEIPEAVGKSRPNPYVERVVQKALKKEREIWWNQKRFKSEREALLHRSTQADEIGLEANAAFRAASAGKYHAKNYEKVLRLYTKAAETAIRDDDPVSAGIYSSMDGMIERERQLHEKEGERHGLAKNQDEEQATGG